MTSKMEIKRSEKTGLTRNYLTVPKLLTTFILIVVLVVGVWYVSNLALTNTSPSGTPPKPASSPTTVIFDFDTGSPVLLTGKSVPFNQIKSGLTAYFSSPSGSATFSVQNDSTTSFKMSQFSGKYLYDTKPSRDILDVKFSAEIIAINFTFATVESYGEDVIVPSELLLTSYKNTNLIGTTKAYGTFSSDSYPQGTLSFNSGEPFNWVRISIPAQASGTTDFLVDNIEVAAASQSSP